MISIITLPGCLRSTPPCPLEAIILWNSASMESETKNKQLKSAVSHVPTPSFVTIRLHLPRIKNLSNLLGVGHRNGLQDNNMYGLHSVLYSTHLLNISKIPRIGIPSHLLVIHFHTRILIMLLILTPLAKLL